MFSDSERECQSHMRPLGRMRKDTSPMSTFKIYVGIDVHKDSVLETNARALIQAICAVSPRRLVRYTLYGREPKTGERSTCVRPWAEGPS